jgi:hypothetical protein
MQNMGCSAMERQHLMAAAAPPVKWDAAPGCGAFERAAAHGLQCSGEQCSTRLHSSEGVMKRLQHIGCNLVVERTAAYGLQRGGEATAHGPRQHLWRGMQHQAAEP